jgi:hypothetical protein
MRRRRCAICGYGNGGSRGKLENFSTILVSMRLIGNSEAHAKCIIKANQQAINFKRRISKYDN